MTVNRSSILRIVVLAVLLAVGVPALAQDSRPPERHALLIGINVYESFQPGDRRQLKYAVNDINALGDELGPRQGWKVVKLDDTRATRKEILKELTDYALELRDVDTFLLFFAGHGQRHPRTKKAYWMTHDSLPRYPDVNNIRLSHLMELVAEIPAGKKIVLLDHCFSGEIELPGASTSVGTRDPSDPVSGVRTDVFPDQELLAQLTPATRGLFVISAARSLALEVADPQDPSRGHGLFTTALLKALRTSEADTDAPQGKLTIEELGKYLAGDTSNPKGEVERLAEARDAFQVAEMKSTVNGQLGWIVAESFVVGGREEAESFRNTLDRWFFNQWLSSAIFTTCQLVLNAWENLGFNEEDLGPEQLEILTLMRQVMPSAVEGESADQIFAGTLARRLSQ